MILNDFFSRNMDYFTLQVLIASVLGVLCHVVAIYNSTLLYWFLVLLLLILILQAFYKVLPERHTTHPEEMTSIPKNKIHSTPLLEYEVEDDKLFPPMHSITSSQDGSVKFEQRELENLQEELKKEKEDNKNKKEELLQRTHERDRFQEELEKQKKINKDLDQANKKLTESNRVLLNDNKIWQQRVENSEGNKTNNNGASTLR